MAGRTFGTGPRINRRAREKVTEERKPWAITHDTVQESRATMKKKSTPSPAVSLLAITISLSPLTAALDITSAISFPLSLHNAGLFGK